MSSILSTFLSTVVLMMTLVLLCSVANGAELWVDRDSLGGQCSDGLSRGEVTAQTPWCTLRKAGEGLLPGDVVTVRAGEYTERHTCNSCNDNAVLQIINAGTQGSPITYRAAPGESVVISGAGGVEDGLEIRLTFDDRQPEWIEVEGFEIRNFSGDCVSIKELQDVTLRDLNVHDCETSAIQLHTTSRVVLESSFIHDNPMSGFTSAVDVFQCGQDNVVRGNFIWNNTDEHPNESEGHGVLVDICPQDALAIIENNVIWDNEGWCIGVYQTPGVTIRNNTCYRNGNGREFTGEVSVLGDNQKLHNNILMPRDGRIGMNIRERTNFPVDFFSTEADGNLIWSPTHDTLVAWSTGTQATVAEYQTTNPYGWGATVLSDDPFLMDPATMDFRLPPNSPVLDNAVADKAAPTDVRGTLRGANPDRGAYEVPAATTGLELIPEPMKPSLVAAGVILLGALRRVRAVRGSRESAG